MNVYKSINTTFDLEKILFHLIQINVDDSIILKWVKSYVLGSTDFRAMSTEIIYQTW
jgi:hypothetical protein